MYKSCLLLFFFCIQVSFAQDEQEDQSAAPYFKVLNTEANIDRLPLLLTTVDVDITGMVAQVQVTQYYKNDGDKTLEVQYVFPGSPEAAVHAVTMKIEDRVVEAKIKTKQKARDDYEAAKQEGKTTSLLEQGDPGLFTMNLANVLPGDEIEVKMLYSERLIPTDGVYQFKYPAIGRPSVLAQGTTQKQQYLPGTGMGFDMVVAIHTPLKLETVNSRNHRIITEQTNANQALVMLDPDESLNFTEDFVIEYALRGADINTGTLVYEEDDMGYFLMMVEPPSEFKPDAVAPREYILVMDSSASMRGAPLENAKYIATQLLSELREQDYFNVVLFATGSQVLSTESLSPTDNNVWRAMEKIDISNAGGGTNLLGALKNIQQIKPIEGLSRSLIVMTDGAIDVSHETLEYIRNNLDQHNVFAIGVSQGYTDESTVKSIARAGQGESFFIEDPKELDTLQNEFLDYIRYPLLTNIEIEATGFDSVDLQPQKVADLFAQRPLYITGRYSSNQRGSLRITGEGNGYRYDEFFDLDGLPTAKNNQAVKYLWAREKIQQLGGGFEFTNARNEKEITALGLDYNLLTPFTSFVAIDDVVRNTGEIVQVKKAPAPTPRLTVSSSSGPAYAIGYAEPGLKLEQTVPNRLPEIAFDDTIQAINAEPLTTQDSVRPDITFILGLNESPTNPYLNAAKTIYAENVYFKTDQVITHLTDLHAVKAFLNDSEQNIGPLGVINIVTHTSPWSGINSTSLDSEKENADIFHLSTVLQQANFSGLSDAIVDASTEIRVIGCALGGHTDLMSQLSVFFGGFDQDRPVVKSPKHHVMLQPFESDDEQVYAFKNPWFYVNPKHVKSEAVLEKVIQAHSPIAERRQLHHWDMRAVTLKSDISTHADLSQMRPLQLALKQKNLLNHLKQIGANAHQFSWVTETTSDGKILLTGTSHMYMLKTTAVHPALLSRLDFADDSLVTSVNPK